MRRSALLLPGLVALLSFPAGPALAASGGTLDQSQTVTASPEAIWDHDRQLAQTFTAGLTGKLDSVSLYLRVVGADYTLPPAGNDLTVSVWATSGGLPTGSSPLANTMIRASTDPGWNEVAFPTPADVVAGTTYAIVAVPNDTLYQDWKGNCGSNAYAGGSALVYDEHFDPAVWETLRSWSADHEGGSSVCHYDFAFRTYVTVAAVEPAAPTVDGLCSTGNDYFWMLGAPQGVTETDVEYATNDDFDNAQAIALGSGATIVATSRANGSTLYVRWADYPDQTASETMSELTVLCQPGSITVHVTVQGGTATADDFALSLTGAAPDPPFGTRAVLHPAAGATTAVDPGWWIVAEDQAAMPAGYHWVSTACGTETTTDPDHPRIVAFVAPGLTGLAASDAVSCTIVNAADAATPTATAAPTAARTATPPPTSSSAPEGQTAPPLGLFAALLALVLGGMLLTMRLNPLRRR